MTKKILISILLAIASSVLMILIKDSYPNIFASITTILTIVGSIFIRLLKLTIVPIVIFSLINGIVNLNNLGELRKIGLKTVIIFGLTTAIALALSISISYLLKAGSSYNLTGVSSQTAQVSAQKLSFVDNIISMAPDNIISPMLNSNMLQVIFIAIIFGIAILGIEKKERKELTSALNHLEEVVIGVIGMIMKITPLGVFALLTKSLSAQGLSILGAMLEYAVIMALIIFVHIIFVYLPMLLSTGVKLKSFLKKTAPASLLAFSTASSAATLPVSMKLTEEDLGVNKSYSSFILPLGATIHMNATAIMQGLALVFLANLYNIELSLIDYLGAAMLAMIATIGAAGIPGTGIITLTMILVQYGIPIEGIGIIIGIDRLMEMLRTLVNVTGDIIVSLVVSKMDNSLDLDIANK
jgi:Na+/H+-dicarboxylate symporter